MKSVILDLHKQLKEGKTTPAKLVENAKALVNKYAFANSVITPIFDAKDAKFNEKNLLSCIPYSLKDNICTKGIKTTGGSKFLKDYVPPYSATVYELLQDTGAILLSKDALDEFGLGGTGTNCFTGPCCNPFDKTRLVGGSTTGGAINVAIGASAFALGTDTGDSVRCPASNMGLVGFKPTYGAISRYGVMPFSPSHDTVGVITKYVADAAIVAQHTFKHDPKDLTSTNLIKDVKFENLKPLKRIRFVVIRNLLNVLDKKQIAKFEKLLEKLKKQGHIIVEVDCDQKFISGDIAANTHKVLSYINAVSNLMNLQGFTFGNKNGDDLDYKASLTKLRTEGFCREVKRRLTIGQYFLNHPKWEEIYHAAGVFRHAYQAETERILAQGDCLLMPTLSESAGASDSVTLYDLWLILSNETGIPEITIPYGQTEKMQWGVSILTNLYQDMKALNIALTVEEIIGGQYE